MPKSIRSNVELYRAGYPYDRFDWYEVGFQLKNDRAIVRSFFVAPPMRVLTNDSRKHG